MKTKKSMRMICSSPLGCIEIETSGNAVVSAMFKKGKALKAKSPAARGDALRQLEEYFLGKRKKFSLRLSPRGGTPFQRRVWEELQKIPYGQTSSYKEVARRIGKPAAVRAVGSAIGKNPFLVFVPCHRVLQSSGKLGGFACGVWRKKELLRLEAK